jgi:hypothetical protein
MADTRVQLEVEDWIRKEWMPKEFGQRFHRDRLKLISGGYFDFDAVNDDETIVASISTTGASTASGRFGVGKMLKIRSDMYFLLMANAQRRIIVLTEPDMYDQCLKEKEGGRIHPDIEFVQVTIPDDLVEKLRKARKLASEEVSPKKRS